MKSNELKKRIAGLCGLASNQIAVRTIPSKRSNPWIDARLRPTKTSLWNGPLQYAGEIPTLFRRIALAVAYGPESELVAQTAAGNIGSHSISLHETEWTRFFETVDAVAACSPDAPEALKLNVALTYLRNRNAVNA